MITFATIVLQGRYDRARQQELQSQLSAAFSLELALLDVRDVTFLDSLSLTELIKLKDQMAHPAVIRIVGAMPHIRKLFDITGLSKLFEMHDSLAAAAAPVLSLAPAIRKA